MYTEKIVHDQFIPREQLFNCMECKPRLIKQDYLYPKTEKLQEDDIVNRVMEHDV